MSTCQSLTSLLRDREETTGPLVGVINTPRDPLMCYVPLEIRSTEKYIRHGGGGELGLPYTLIKDLGSYDDNQKVAIFENKDPGSFLD